MATFYHFLLFVLFLSFHSTTSVRANEEKKVYIVYMGALPKDENDVSVANSHIDLLNSVLENGLAEDSLVRSYKRSFNGFVAKLTEYEKIKLSEKEDVVSVFPDRLYSTHTTHSWDFLGLNINSRRNLKLERDIIVGVIDTGIWPESESFSDKGLGPPPKKWKGICHQGFPCNNKIIGARFYNNSDSARDKRGHGTHVASIIAGAVVHNGSLNHLGEGTARGGVPSARLAIYNICSSDGNSNASLALAAFNDAIADGVDMISLSMGGHTFNYKNDPVAIGSFHAMANGVLTSAAAGNKGPYQRSVDNVAPWLMSVAASSIDRWFTSEVVLGNDEFTVKGLSVNPFETEELPRPFVRFRGAAGYVFVNDSLDYGSSHAIRTSVIKLKDSEKVLDYLKYPNTTAKICKSEETLDSDAPKVASFSSRGPNHITSDIMKPDIAAPGVNILAAWSPIGELVTGYEKKYNIISGTSMACPHATAAAAYVKSFHPTWSPAALRSALMTTATPMSSTKNIEAEFAYGSGQINPTKAVSPGLVYETRQSDYIELLCVEGWTDQDIRLITGDKKSSCPQKRSMTSVRDLNYPSMTYEVQNSSSFSVSFLRRVTNVGLTGTKYTVKIISDNKISIKVSPSILMFKAQNEELKFTVTVSGSRIDPTWELQVFSGAIVWSDGDHSVRSPVVVYCNRIV